MGDQSAQNEQLRHGSAGVVLGGRGDRAVVDDPHARRVDALLAELGAGHLGNRNVRPPSVHPGSEPRLDPPAHARSPRPEHHGPLLAVHVMDQHHMRCSRGPKSRQVGNAVLSLDDELRTASAPSPMRQSRLQIHGEPTTPTEHPHPAGTPVLAVCPRVAGGQQDHLMSTLGQTVGDALGIHLGAASLRMSGVPPVQHQDPSRVWT